MFRSNRAVATLTVLCLLTIFLSSAQAQINDLSVAYSTWSPNGQFIALINSQRVSDTIEIFAPEMIPVVTLHIDALLPDMTGLDIGNIAWSNDSTSLAAIFSVAGQNSLPQVIVAVWNTDDWTLRFAVPYRASQLAWSPSGNYLGAGTFIIDAMTGDLVNQIAVSDPSAVRVVGWNPANEEQYLVGFELDLDVLDPLTGQSVQRFRYTGLINPDFSPNGRYLALANFDWEANPPTDVVNIIDMENYQLINSIQPSGVLGEPYALNWLTNDQLSLMMSDQPFTVVNPFDGTVLDTNSFGSYTWNPEGTQALYRPLLPNGQGRFLAIVDRQTEAIVHQFWTVPTVRQLAITNPGGEVQTTLGAGEGIINDISMSAVNSQIQAFTYPESVGSVAFDVNGARTIINTAPYTIALLPQGTYTISAIPYSAADGQGDPGLPFTAIIQVIADEPIVTSTPNRFAALFPRCLAPARRDTLA